MEYDKVDQKVEAQAECIPRICLLIYQRRRPSESSLPGAPGVVRRRLDALLADQLAQGPAPELRGLPHDRPALRRAILPQPLPEVGGAAPLLERRGLRGEPGQAGADELGGFLPEFGGQLLDTVGEVAGLDRPQGLPPLPDEGEKEEAGQVLESVFRQLLAEPSPGEAALAALDLALVLAESGRAGEIQGLAQALEKPLQEPDAWFLSVKALVGVAGRAASGRPGLEKHVRHAAAGLRRSLRSLGVPLRPFPFV